MGGGEGPSIAVIGRSPSVLPHLIHTQQAADRSKEVEVLKKRQAVEEGEMKVR